MDGKTLDWTRGTAMTKKKLIAMIAGAVLVLVIVLQNTQAVDTKILFITVTMPRAILLFVAALVGFVIGLIAAGGKSKSKETQAGKA
jgi:uncharacterized integral membrane protein